MKSIISKRSFVFIFLIVWLIPQSSIAWSNYFRFINNFNVPMIISIDPTLGQVVNLCGKSIKNIEVAANSLSCELQFDTDKLFWYSSPQNSGNITISKKDDPQSYCIFKYDYSYSLIPYSYFDLHSENISKPICHGNLKANEISVVNTHNQALPRSIVGVMASKVTSSIAHADCGGQGGDNCLIASPDLTTVYKTNGSTLAQSLLLQTKLDQYEPLNFEQFIGTHNSAISPIYTISTHHLNLSYSDPDNYLTLTEQLNVGVRQLELDVMWTDNELRLCHANKYIDPAGSTCKGNFSMATAIAEVKTWIENNPDALIFIYLDVHMPLTSHVADLDKDLSSLSNYIFTPQMAIEHFHVHNNTLPAYQLTQYNLINQFHKNIIITNDNDRANLIKSRYVFVKIQNSDALPLNEISVDTFLAIFPSCSDKNKHDNIRYLFKDDPSHYNVLRLNAGRTALNYLTSVKLKSPDQYVNYFTTQNLQKILNCPINILSTSMLGFTCDSSQCDAHPTDPKLYTFLWSWGLGYPLQQGGSNLAYINTQTNHFENDPLVENNTYGVLCYRSTGKQNAPTAPLNWYVNTLTLKNAATAFEVAQLSCQQTGGIFAVPTMSYWMHDVMSIIKSKKMNILVNYKKDNKQWIANGAYVSQKDQTILRGHSLVLDDR
ncbi:MAG: PI-PLC domain-containing protein [Gammaproteobacteria bacterium]